MPDRIIEAERSIVVAADVEPMAFVGLVQEIGHVAGLGAYKVGFEVGLGMGLAKSVETVQEYSGVPVIYDHQKAGNDIPETGMNFARAMKGAGVDAAILFPFTGPKTQESWIKELQEAGVEVIVGAEMTHDHMKESDGGYIRDAAFLEIFYGAIKFGVRNFVVPGNKVDRVEGYRRVFDKELGEGEYDLFAPGFIAQGGVISETGKAAGPRFHGIVGTAIYKAEDPQAAVEQYAAEISDS